MPHLPDHATHDPELIAAYAAGDAAGPDLALATELVAACTDCADLHRDLRAIATALPDLPVPDRPRDFRLTPEQASALGPSGWRAVLAAFGSPRFRLAAPLGTGLAAVGLAGLLLATPGSLLPRSATSGAGAGAPAPAAAEATSGPVGGGALAVPPAASPAPAEMASAAASAGPDGGQVDTTGATRVDGSPNPDAFTGPAAATAGPAGNAPAASPDREMALKAASPAPGTGGSTSATDASTAVQPEATAQPSPWLAVSLALLVIGVALVTLRVAARSAGRR